MFEIFVLHCSQSKVLSENIINSLKTERNKRNKRNKQNKQNKQNERINC
jgi:hypothetical protein